MKKLILIFIYFLLAFSFPVSITTGQQSNVRPKVGLALSGGGSCGIAHIGVIKAMEESGLRPDLITGVSMGSLIGALYAMGYSSDSLEKIFKQADWDLLINNKLPENKIIFPEKKHFYNSVISIPVTLKKSILPQGLINGQQMENMLSFFAWPAAAINDFSKLPIPFMCLATNLVTCKKTELTHGYLPDAIMASSAVPTIFAPVKIDSLLLVDGGMIRNLAISEAKDMGADIVIGSYTGSYLSNENELQSVTDIITQLGFFIGVYDFQEQRKLANIIIEPYTDDLSSTSFTNIDTIIQRGYNAALPFKSKFKRIADSLNQFGPQLPVKYILDRQLYKFDRIQINGNKKISSKQILGVLGIRPGEEIDKYLLNKKMDLLYGKAWFDKVKYRIVPKNDSLILNIDCNELSKAILYGSVHYDNALHSGFVIGLSVKNPLVQRSLLEVNSFIGHNYRLSADYYQYIDRNQKYGLSANFYLENTLLPMLKLRGETGNVFSRNFYQGITIGKRLGLNHLMNIFGRIEILNLIPDYITSDNMKSLSHNYMTAGYEYKINTLDIKHFPSRGNIFNFSVTTSKLLSSTYTTNSLKTTYKETGINGLTFKRFYTISTNFSQYLSRGKKITFLLGGNFLYISDSDSVSRQNNFWKLGGVASTTFRSIPMIGFHPNQISVNKMAGLIVETDYEPAASFHISIMANISAIKDYDNEEGFTILGGYGVSVGFMTIFGPLKAGIMHGLFDKEKYFNEIKGYISLGYSF